MIVVQLGPSMAKLMPTLKVGENLAKCWSLESPAIDFSYEAILTKLSTLFVMIACNGRVRLRGQMLPIARGEQIVFLCSPWLPEPGEFTSSGLTFQDFPLHDSMPEFMVQMQRLGIQDLRKLSARLCEQRESLADLNLRLVRQEAESRKLALIAARTENGVVITDALGRVDWVNEAFTKYTGFTLAELRGKTPGAVLQGPETDPASVEYMRGKIREGQSFHCEVLNYRKGGGKYWVALEGQPIRDEAGQVTNFMAIESDVTARREEEQRKSLLHSVTTLFSNSTDLEVSLLEVLHSIVKFLGYQFAVLWRFQVADHKLYPIRFWSPPELRNSWLERETRSLGGLARCVDLPGVVWDTNEPVILPDLSSSPIFSRRDSALKDGLRCGFAFPIRIAGEARGVIELLAIEHRPPGTEVLALLTTLGNQIGQFMERQQAEKSLRESEESYRVISASASDGIITVDRQNHIIYANEAAKRIFDYPPDALMMRPLSELMAPQYRNLSSWSLMRIVRKSLADDCTRPIEVVGRRRDGSLIPLEVSFGQSHIQGKRVFTGVIRDITVRKQTDIALRRAMQQIESANQAKSDFLAGISHEIRTPLNSITGLSELLLETPLEGDQKEMASTIWVCSESLLNLVNDLLDFSSIEAGQVEISSKEFDLAAVCERAVSIMSSRARQKRLALVCTVEPRPAPCLLGDAARISQMLVNLIANGIKFTATGSVCVDVRWNTQQPGTAAVDIFVRDTGIGIVPGSEKQIFEKFYRIDTPTGRRAGGTGLGLSISRRLAEQMHGTLDVEVGRQPGSCFRLGLTLPVVSGGGRHCRAREVRSRSCCCLNLQTLSF